MHDVGKLYTPRAILENPGFLTDDEYRVLRRHPVDGADLLADAGDPEIALMVRHHHERVDGGGYPDGLAGDEIPLGARIIAVADTFDAICSERVYRSARSHEHAIAVLRQEAGTQLDEAVVEAFVSSHPGAVGSPAPPLRRSPVSARSTGCTAPARASARVRRGSRR